MNKDRIKCPICERRFSTLRELFIHRIHYHVRIFPQIIANQSAKERDEIKGLKGQVKLLGGQLRNILGWIGRSAKSASDPTTGVAESEDGRGAVIK